MKKSDLKSGMLIKNSEGKMGIVLIGSPEGDNIVSNGNNNSDTTWSPLSSFNDDLTSKHPFNNNIDEVWSYSNNMNVLTLNTENRTLLWKRKINPKIKLNEGYEALVNHDTKMVIVGCQSIPFAKVEELYKLIKS